MRELLLPPAGTRNMQDEPVGPKAAGRSPPSWPKPELTSPPAPCAASCTDSCRCMPQCCWRRGTPAFFLASAEFLHTIIGCAVRSSKFRCLQAVEMREAHVRKPPDLGIAGRRCRSTCLGHKRPCQQFLSPPRAPSRAQCRC